MEWAWEGDATTFVIRTPLSEPHKGVAHPPQTVTEQLRNRRDGWGESLAYFGVGSFVREGKWESQDQQLPLFLRRCIEPLSGEQETQGSEGRAGRIKLFLVDACFPLHPPPLCVRVEGTSIHWDVVTMKDCTLYTHSNMAICVVRNYVERETELWESMRVYMKELLLDGGAVLMGCYAQPYYINEDNLSILELYTSLREDASLQDTCTSCLDNLRMWMLGDYATHEHGTIVWLIKGDYNQDIALMKEVARFKGDGLNGGVPEYAYMNSQYGIGRMFLTPDCIHPDTGRLKAKTYSSSSTLHAIQSLIEKEIQRMGGDTAVLRIDEGDINFMPFTFLWKG